MAVESETIKFTDVVLIPEPEKPSLQDNPAAKKTETETEPSSSLWVAFKEAVNASTVHGLADIYRYKSIFLRIFLVLYVATSFSLCVYMIVVSILSYLKFSVVTDWKTHWEAPAQFPVVAICNLNPFDQNFAFKNISNYTDDGTIKMSDFSNSMDYLVALNDYFRANLIKKYLQQPYWLYYYNFYLGQMLLGCRFQDRSCSKNEFMLFYDYYYGLCFRFNQGQYGNGTIVPILTSGQPGWRYGLQLELYTGSAKLQEKFISNRGFRILIFNQTNLYQVAQDVGINVATGQETNIGVRRVFTSHLAAPYSDCLSSDIDEIDWKMNDVLSFMYTNFIQDNYFFNGQFTLNQTLTYTQYICLKMCFQKYLFNACGCYDITQPKSQALAEVYADMACANVSQLDCMKSTRSYFYDKSDLATECYEKCPVECEQINYEFTISTSTYPTEWYAELLANSSNFNYVINNGFRTANVSYINYVNKYQELKNSVAKVNVFYETLYYTHIEETPSMDFFLLVGNIGGSLALFLGASLITFTEPIGIIYTVLAERLSICIKKRSV